MTQAELDKRIKKLLEYYDEVTAFYVELIAAHLAQIGGMDAPVVPMIEVMAEMYDNITEIKKHMVKASQQARPELYKIYNTALNDVYHDDRFKRALAETPLQDSSKRALERYAQDVSRQVANDMENLSHTTVIDETYRQAVNKAVIAVSSGLGDYSSMIRKSLRELGSNGLQVEYESGYHRRLDSALRQNIIDGAREILQHASNAIGEELGYDAKELTAHPNSAPDHEPVQGRVFLNEEFERLQNDEESEDIDGRKYPAMERAIGQWNCRHYVYPFSTKYSKRKYTAQQLDDMARKNAEGCEIDGKHYSLYEASQLMRQIETAIRREKDVAVAAKAAGDMDLRRECQSRINALKRKYSKVADAAGLRERTDRMSVQGFKAVKSNDGRSEQHST